jgi:hypothetical protein
MVAVVGLTGIPLITEQQPPSPDGETNGLIVSTNGPSCVDTITDSDGGWVHVVADGNQYDVTFNLTVSHDSRERVSTDLASDGSGVYELQFVTDSNRTTAREETQSRETTQSCSTGTKLVGAVSLPTEFERLDVTVNDNRVATFERVGTFPTLRELPNPVSTTSE